MEICRIVQLIYIFAIFFLTLLFVLLPLKLIPADRMQLGTRRSQRIIDFCNCFASGVFLATCFVQLIPYVEQKFHLAFTDGGFPIMYSQMLSQIMIMLGFFLVLLMEQTVKTCQKGTQTRGEVDDMQKPGAVKNGYVVAVSSSDNSLGSDESDVELSREKKQMLKPKDKTKLRTTNGRHLHRQTVGTAPQRKSDQCNMPNGRGRGRLNGSDLVFHTHAHTRLADLAKEEFGLRCVILLFALTLHSLFEGVAIGLQEDLYKLTNLAVGIGIHECLVAFALGTSLARQNLARPMVVALCLLFSAAIPLGIGIGMGVGVVRGLVTTVVSAVLQALTAGTFLYVIFVEILPNEIDRNRDRLLKVLIMFVGFCIISSLGFIMKSRH